jgi:thiol-disulfide isomerase/thioredoxin
VLYFIHIISLYNIPINEKPKQKRCGHCKKLKPEYAKAATAMKSRQVILAKADATDKSLTELSKKLDVTGYPSLFVLHGGNVIAYGGGRTFKDLVDTSNRIISQQEDMEDAMQQYLASSMGSDRDGGASSSSSSSSSKSSSKSSPLLIRDENSMKNLLLNNQQESKLNVLAFLVVPPSPSSSSSSKSGGGALREEELKNVFSAFSTMAGRISADPSLLGTSDIEVKGKRGCFTHFHLLILLSLSFSLSSRSHAQVSTISKSLSASHHTHACINICTYITGDLCFN